MRIGIGIWDEEQFVLVEICEQVEITFSKVGMGANVGHVVWNRRK